jgi:hypothetical protein
MDTKIGILSELASILTKKKFPRKRDGKLELYCTRHGFVICRQKAESRKQESRRPSEDGVTNRPVVLICVLLSAFYLASLSRAKYIKCRRRLDKTK